MQHEEESVTFWLKHLKAGDSHAGQKLWCDYVAQLVRVARTKLGRMPRRVADEEDVVLSAFNALLSGIKQGRFPRLNDRDDLWQILVMLTERKAVKLRRHLGAEKRGAGVVYGESILDRPGVLDGSARGLDAMADCGPSAEFSTSVAQELDHQLGRLNDDLLQKLALGKLEGYTNRELAHQLEISVRAVERKLSIIRRTWKLDADLPDE